VPTHKSVGKNGTFWLPPESANSFSSKLKDLSKKNPRSLPKNPQNASASPAVRAKQGGSPNAQSNLTVSRNLNRPATVRNSQILQSTQSHSKPNNASNNSGVQVQSNLSPRAFHGVLAHPRKTLKTILLCPMYNPSRMEVQMLSQI